MTAWWVCVVCGAAGAALGLLIGRWRWAGGRHRGGGGHDSRRWR